MDDPKVIAARLTEAQRRWFLFDRHDRARSWPSKGPQWGEVGRPLKEQGLLQFVEDQRSSMTVLTPLGLAVREILRRQS